MNLARRIIRSLARRAFEAAGPSHPQGRWPVAAAMPSPRAAVSSGLSTLHARSNHLAFTTPVGASITNVFVTHLVGDGPSVTSEHAEGARRFEDWFYSGRCGIDGSDGVNILCCNARGMVAPGEHFNHLLTTENAELRVQGIPADQIAATGRDLPDGSRIESGVELDAFGAPRAYYVRDDRRRGELLRIPASEVLHAFERVFAGQVRGISPLTAVATSINQLATAEDAVVTKALVTALHCGFIKDLDGSGSGLSEGSSAADPSTLSMEPGTIRHLPPGTDIEFPPTSDQSGVDSILRHMTRSIAAGVGAPFELVSGNLSEVSFASGRIGMFAFQRRLAQLRASVLATRLLAPLYRRFVLLEILSGRLDAPGFERDPESWLTAEFLWPAWPSLNPFDDARAAQIEIELGTRSRAEVIAARGRSIQDVDAERAADTFTPSPNRPALRLVEPENAA